MRRKGNYVNNRDFYNAIIEYQNTLKEIENKEDYPKVPKYIAECIIEISRRIASKKNFNGYSYVDEMIADGIENGLASIEKFNPEKSDNPFAYFSQIIINAFIRRIKTEKKHSYIKHASLEKLSVEMMLETNGEIQQLVDNKSDYSANHQNYYTSNSTNQVVEK